MDRPAAGADGPEPLRDLAAEIRRAVDRFVADDAADPSSLSAALDGLGRQELAAMARSAFDRLEPLQQWAILERALGEAGAVDALSAEQRGRLGALRRRMAAEAVVDGAVVGDTLDLRALPEGTELRIGLFRPGDLRSAAGRGADSEVCAREVLLRSGPEPGELRVVDDEFNPRGGLFVSADYDRDVWESERLDSHSTVSLGWLGGPDAASLQPQLRRGARVDSVADGRVVRGRLHLGWAVVDGVDAFTPAG